MMSQVQVSRCFRVLAMMCGQGLLTILIVTIFTQASAAQVVRLEGLEVTQAIQSMDFADSSNNNRVPLIKNKKTLVRAHVSGSGRIKGRLLMVPSGLPSEMVDSDNSVDVPAVPNRDILEASLNFPVPKWMLTANTIKFGPLLVEDIGFQNPFHPPLACSNCATYTPIKLHFFDSPPLRVKLVGVQFQQGLMMYPTPRDEDYKAIESWLRRAYPVAPQKLKISRVSTVLDLDSINKNYNDADCTEVNIIVSAMRTQDLDSAPKTDPLWFTHYIGLVYEGLGGPPPPFYKRGCAQYVVTQPDFAVVASAAVGQWGEKAEAPWYGELGGGVRGYWDNAPSYGGWYAGQELGHLLGISHADKPDFAGGQSVPATICVDPKTYLGPYPFYDGQLSNADNRYVGFDSGDSALGIARQALSGQIWHDVTTYCIKQWISSVTYSNIRCRLHYEENGSRCPGLFFHRFSDRLEDRLEAISRRIPLKTTPPIPKPGPPPGPIFNPYLSILATVNLHDQTGEIRFVTRALKPGANLGPKDPRAELRVRTATGTRTYPVNAPDGEERLSDNGPSSIAMTVPAARRLELLIGGKVVSVRQPSAKLPGISNIRLRAPIEANQPVLIWDADETQDPNIYYSVQLSFDGGKTWDLVAVALSKREFKIPVGKITDFAKLVVRIQVSDGFRSVPYTAKITPNSP